MHALQTQKSATVILIDGEESTRHSLEWLIQSLGHNVHAYDSGLSYLDAAVGSDRPDCMILDTHMQEINGLELYGIMKTQYPDLPVIFVTGLPDQPIAQKARSIDSTGFFIKPVDSDALAACLGQALAFQLQAFS